MRAGDDMTAPAIAEAAASLAALGFMPIPLSASRKPILTGWPDAEPGEDAARARFGACNAQGVAVVTRGFIVVDLDRGHAEGVDGVENFAALIAEHGDFPNHGPVVQTQRGGLHVWLAAPADVDVRASASKIAPGVDIKAGRALATCPPTPGYSWIAPLVLLAGLPMTPDWLVRLACPPPPPPVYGPHKPIRGADAYARAVLARELDAVARADKGGRNGALFRAAARLGELAAAALIPAETAAAGLLAAAEASGLTRDDGQRAVEATIASGLRKGAANPSPRLGGRRHVR